MSKRSIITSVCIFMLILAQSCGECKSKHKSKVIVHKIKPKYKLGDIVYNKLDNEKYLIIGVPENNTGK